MSSETMIVVSGGDAGDLAMWLTAELDLRGGVRQASEAAPPGGPSAGLTQLAVSLTAGAGAAALASALIAWLRRRTESVTVRVSLPDGGMIELSAHRVREMNATAVRAQVDQLAALVLPGGSTGAEPGAVIPGSVVGEMKAGSTVESEAYYYDDGYAGVLADNRRIRYYEDAIAARDARAAMSGEGREAAGGAFDTASSGQADENAGATIPVTIYLSDGSIHGQVETAVEELLASAGLRIEDRDEPVIGSWFRRMWAPAKEILRSPAGHEAVGVAIHAADTRTVLAQDAAVTATLLQNLAPVIASLQPTQDAQLRVGALLIVKVNWVVNVFQLTAAQQAKLDHQPQLALSPREIIAALDLNPPP